MNNTIDQLHKAFDLSFLDSTGFPETQFKSVGILGGGTAGYFTALALKTCHPNMEVNVIESSKIPVIGVGESTTTEILPFLHHVLGFDPIEFFEEVEPTLKLGIQFDWGCPGDYKFNFNFFASHHYESYFYENSIDNCNWASVLMNEKRLPLIKEESGHHTSLMGSIPFSYHVDNKKFVSYLNKKVQDLGIPIIDAEVKNVNLDENGFVESLETLKKDKLSYDFYVDCSGFRSKIIGETLKTDFISFDTTLVTDKALTFSLPNNKVIDPYTSALTMENGWCWKIPMRESDHYGYVFSSKFCDEAEALKEVEKKFGPIEGHKIINFRSGRHEKAWNKNVFALGNAYAFVEPLESTAIQTVISSAMLLCRLMPHSLGDKSTITGLNKEIAATWDTFRWFLGVHYKFNKKLVNPFWNWCRENVDIGDAQEIIDLFHERAPLSRGHYGTNTGYSAHEPLVFNAYSYDSLLFGQKEVSKNLKAPLMSEEEYREKVNSYKELAESSMSAYELLNNKELLYNEVLPLLFNDPESWIVDTQV